MAIIRGAQPKDIHPIVFGGTVNAGVHIDCVIHQPTVYIDNELIMEKGNLLI